MGASKRPTRVDVAWQIVTCSDCGVTYQCTPNSDYYNATTLDDGVCERCLLRAAGMGGARVLDLRGRPQG